MTTEADVRGYGQYEYSRGVRAGERRGRKEGRKEGKEEGRKETARIMLASGYPIAEIVRISGLAEEEVKALRD